MALDCELLSQTESGEAGFRVYTWDGVWVSLGRNQSVEEALVDPSSTNWVRRPTGGAAVLHGNDITVSIAIPFSNKCVKAYRVVTEPLVEALRTLGVAAAFAEDLEADIDNRSLPDCFASTGKNDIVDPLTREKICGCALRRTRKAVLLQASIPVSEPQRQPEEVLRHGVRSTCRRVEEAALHGVLEAILHELRP